MVTSESRVLAELRAGPSDADHKLNEWKDMNRREASAESPCLYQFKRPQKAQWRRV